MIHNWGSVTVVDSDLEGGYSADYALSNFAGATMTLRDTTIGLKNVLSNEGTVKLVGVTMTKSTSNMGGPITNRSGGVMTIEGSRFTDNYGGSSSASVLGNSGTATVDEQLLPAEPVRAGGDREPRLYHAYQHHLQRQRPRRLRRVQVTPDEAAREARPAEGRASVSCQQAARRMAQVTGRGLEPIGIITEVADADVAAVAEQPADLARLMVVVEREYPLDGPGVSVPQMAQRPL